MIKAIVKNGVVVPRDPLPADWQEGTEVDVQKSLTNGTHPANPGPCKAGSYRKPEFWMAPDFNAPLEDFKDYME